MSTLANKMALMGYVRATDRPCCRNCPAGVDMAGDRNPPYSYRCTTGGFWTTAMAVCDEHPAMQPLEEE